MLRSKRSVVARSAPMLFSSCPVDLNPRVERGSVNIFRSVRFWRHSLIAFHTMLSSFSKIALRGQRSNLQCAGQIQVVSATLFGDLSV
jgi:hypothetical protein